MIAKLLLQNTFFVVGIEERALAAGLPGYADYAARVRYRLVPGVW
jgi:protein-S-isoprenylcysteine O-methyltransferase Ste14